MMVQPFRRHDLLAIVIQRSQPCRTFFPLAFKYPNLEEAHEQANCLQLI